MSTLSSSFVGRSRRRRGRHLLSHLYRILVLFLVTAACSEGGSPAAPDEQEPDPPGPGPWFSVTPIPLDSVVRITPVGHNNKILPTGHTYWDTCDIWALMPTGRCIRQKLDIRAPRDAVVLDVNPVPDGFLALEGPPGLHMGFGHVTPAAGLERGDTVRAGDIVARMHYDHGFDFGVEHFGLEPQPLLRPERAPLGYPYSQSPIAQYPDAIRTQLEARVQTEADPLGRVAFDAAGTAQGIWFVEGTPDSLSFHRDWAHVQLFLGPLQERHETRILSSGHAWPGNWAGLTVADPSTSPWDEITPASGPVTVRAWNLGSDGRPNLEFPRGTWLLQMIEPDRLRLEWFDGHGSEPTFSAAALVYER